MHSELPMVEMDMQMIAIHCQSSTVIVLPPSYVHEHPLQSA